MGVSRSLSALHRIRGRQTQLLSLTRCDPILAGSQAIDLGIFGMSSAVLVCTTLAALAEGQTRLRLKASPGSTSAQRIGYTEPAGSKSVRTASGRIKNSWPNWQLKRLNSESPSTFGSQSSPFHCSSRLVWARVAGDYLIRSAEHAGRVKYGWHKMWMG